MPEEKLACRTSRMEQEQDKRSDNTAGVLKRSRQTRRPAPQQMRRQEDFQPWGGPWQTEARVQC